MKKKFFLQKMGKKFDYPRYFLTHNQLRKKI